jgi:predicted PurR-regulated permease PerM
MAEQYPEIEHKQKTTPPDQDDTRKGIAPRSLSARNLPWGGIAVAVTVAIVTAVLILAALWLFARTLALLALGIAIAAALAPLVARLEERIPRTLAVLLVYLAILVIFVLIASIILPPVFVQVQDIAERAPELISEVERLYERYAPVGEIPVVDQLVDQLGQVLGRLVAVPLGLASGLIDLVLILFVSLYTLIEAPRMRRFALSLFPEGRRPRVDHILNSMAQAMGGFIRGAVITAIIIGVVTSIGLSLIGIPYPLVLGLVAGVLELLPYVGPIIASVPMLIVALLQSPTQALIVLVFFVILQQLESNVLVPNIMKTQTEISPLLSIIAIVAGASLGGILGALVAIPIAASLRVFVREVVAPAVRKQTGASQYQEDDTLQGE